MSKVFASITSLVVGADVIRQALEQDLVDELSIVIAPLVPGGGKRLFEGFTRDVELEHVGVHSRRTRRSSTAR